MFKKSIIWATLAVSLFHSAMVSAQDYKTENVILITLDGMRWQEVFTGADSLLVDDTGMIETPGSLLPDFWDVNPLKRREMLFPFLWNTIAKEGQIYGNRAFGNKVNNQNTMWFSYPGYNEFLSGFADDKRITSNDKMNNPNKTMLEYLNEMPEYNGKVLAFGSWDVFPYIVNEERSGIPVNAGFDIAKGDDLSPEELLTNKMQSEIRGPWGGVRLDVFTQNYAMAALKNQKPKVTYISYGETDDWAHENHYDQYIWSAKQTDAYIKEIWDFVQSDPQYKDKTTLIIGTDHGRGTTKTSWTGHGSSIHNAGEIWLAAIGPDTPALGEVKSDGQLQSAMVARTVFKLLGLEYPDEKAAPVIKEMVK
ncbi:alkaline phosphatase family protein [Algoriphagus aquimarinus]|uniref:Metalloenzyme superfamily protein n=1 Tax=Algoriphagus aquimarinus TaxID=237018 RepID=A0A1I1CEY4_9BACT|nr:alkaline phosphatase family protein [Algoriphagus aquimarinus]SFB61209.1 Metalloenzyme superfamily protein [Algoriphagus aquimarinus]